MNQKEFLQAYANSACDRFVQERLGNVIRQGTVIYSYGSHFPMAKIDRASRVAYVNKDKYSQSTSKQQGYLRHALTQAGYEIENTNTNSLKEMI